MQGYVLIDPGHAGVEVFGRDAAGHGVLYPYGPHEVAAFTSVGMQLPVAAVFEDVLPPSSAAGEALPA